MHTFEQTQKLLSEKADLQAQIKDKCWRQF